MNWSMSGQNSRQIVEEVERAKAVGMNGHFAKPLDIMAINMELSKFST